MEQEVREQVKLNREKFEFKKEMETKTEEADAVLERIAAVLNAK